MLLWDFGQTAPAQITLTAVPQPEPRQLEWCEACGRYHAAPKIAAASA